MEYVILVLGALGAWLLVAGPLFQASLELHEQEIDREEIDRVTSTIEAPAPISPWWWLLPPVAYVKQRRQSKAHRQAVMDALGPQQLEQTISFLDKASGWMIVAAGAFLIAIKETYEVVELFEWPIAVFWVIVVVAPVLCIGNTAMRAVRSAKALGIEQPPPRAKRASAKRA
jgi:hypothetical protein